MVTLPWGAPIRVRPGEVIGSNIWCYGIFDLAVAEAIWRLSDLSEVAVDIGANIGQMTSLMQHRVGPTGRVLSFEPHPELFSELRYNTEQLLKPGKAAPVELHNVALSDASRDGFLDAGSSWATNRGMSRVLSDTPKDTAGVMPVSLTTLDEIVGEGTSVGVCKIDVEGHELAVLRGGAQLLGDRHVRDIVFEDFGEYPSEVHRLLLANGFTLFSLHTGVMGPRISPASERLRFKAGKEGQNYVATLDSERTVERFRARGWRALGR